MSTVEFDRCVCLLACKLAQGTAAEAGLGPRTHQHTGIVMHTHNDRHTVTAGRKLGQGNYDCRMSPVLDAND